MSQKSRRSGFTLIELLVVIAIIAILAAILFPVFARAREQARKTSCLSNLKQLGTAAHMYAQDFDETVPSWPFNPTWSAGGGVRNSPDWNLKGGWTYVMWQIQPYIKNAQILTCPSARDQWGGTAPYRANRSYGYSEYLYDANRNWMKLSALSSGRFGVAEIAMFADSRFAGIFNDWDAGNTGGTTGYQVTYLARVALADDTKPRHEGSNFTFCDGHAKFVPLNKILCPLDSGRNGEYPIVNPGAAFSM